MVDLTDKAITIDSLLSHLEDGGSGGLVIFIGRVRNHSQGSDVVALEYDAYAPMALKQMAKIEEQARQSWPVREFVMVHRLGHLEVGEASVVIIVACAHRAEAFAACRFAIESLKRTVPIWKKEYRPDGSHWVEGVSPQAMASASSHIDSVEEAIT